MAETSRWPSNRFGKFTSSLESRLLYERIKKMEVGETIPYRELSEIIGKDVQTSGRGAMTSARKMALRDDRIVADTLPNIGLVRISDAETVASATLTFKKVQRAVRRGAVRITAVDFEHLSNDDKLRHNASLSAFLVIKMMGRPKTIERLAGAVNCENTGQLPIGRTLELFRGPKRI